MGWWSRLGNKISHAVSSGARIGMKALGTASRIGHKVSDVGHSIVDTLKASPLSMVPVLSTAINVGDKVLGLVDKGTKYSDTALEFGHQVQGATSKGKSHLEKKAPPVAHPSAGIQAHTSTPSNLRSGIKEERMPPPPTRGSRSRGGGGGSGNVGRH